jgi:hypothetical protein
MTRAEADPPPGAVDAEEPVSLLLSAFETVVSSLDHALELENHP